MNKIGLSALALVATAGSAFGQLDPARFRLDLFLQGRTYSNTTAGTSTDATNATSPIGPINSATATLEQRTIRLEIRYRITVLQPNTPNSGSYTSGGTTYLSSGLSSASLNLASSRTLNVGDLKAAQVSSDANAAAQPTNPDTLDLSDGTLGLYTAFRTGVFADVPAGTGLGNNNGTFSPAGLANILPIATGAPGQRSNLNSNGNLWSVYAVDFVIPQNAPAGTWTFNLSQNPGSEWLFFPRTGASDGVGITGLGGITFGPGVSITIVPAPGAAALLGLGGLVAARRRRTA